jgi:hypothetical protein
VSTETIYQSLYVQSRGALKQELTTHLPSASVGSSFGCSPTGPGSPWDCRPAWLLLAFPGSQPAPDRLVGTNLGEVVVLDADARSNPMSFDDLIELRFLPSRRRHRDPDYFEQLKSMISPRDVSHRVTGEESGRSKTRSRSRGVRRFEKEQSADTPSPHRRALH